MARKRLPPASLPEDPIGFEELSLSAIRRWRLVLVASVGLLLLAWMAWVKIPRLEDPKVDVAEAGVILVYPGASPEDVESQVLKPVEEVLFGLENIDWIEGSATPNMAFLRLKFDDATNMDVMVEKIRGKVQAKRKDLPAEVKDPEVIRYSTSLTPQMIISLVGNRSLDVLTEGAKRLKDNLNTVPGVAGIDLLGDCKPAVRVRLDALKLRQHRLTPDQVVRQLQLGNVRVPGGALEVGELSTLLQVNQELRSAEDVMKVPVGASIDGRGGSRTIALGDVADVRDENLRQKTRFVFRGVPGVALAVKFRSGENAVAVGEAVRAKLQAIQSTFPDGTRVQIAHDQPKWISKSISNFLESLAEGIVLVLAIITLGMGWRAALVVSGVLPLAAGGAIFGLYVGGFALEQVSIAGLIVALGLLVDDAVVVTESIQVMRDKGLTQLRAAVLGTARVFWANNGTTAVAVASFLPLYFMGGTTGLFIKGLPTAVILALVTSLLVAQFFTPWASTFFLPKPDAVEEIPDTTPFLKQDDSADPQHGEHNVAIRWLKVQYVRHIPWVMGNPLKVIGVFVVLLAGSLLLLPGIGFEFFPKAQKPALFVILELPKGARPEATAGKVSQALEVIHRDPAVEDTSAVVGAGFPQIFGGRISRRQSGELADILVRLREGQPTDEVAIRLRKNLRDLTGVNVVVEELWHGPPVAHPITIRVYGDDYIKLRAYAEEVKEQLLKQKGPINVKDSLTESIPLTRVQLDADRALRTGLTPGQVGGTLRWLYGEDKVTEFRRGDDQVQVVLDPVPAPDRAFSTLEETPIPSSRGTLVPLREAGQVQLGFGYAELKRRNTRRMVEITADVENVRPNDVISKVDPWLKKKKWETGYGFAYAGTQEETAKSFRNLAMAAIGAVVIIFLLLVLMFDSLTLAFIVILAVPFALIGALSGLAITGNAFGFMAFLGLIALIGVYVNHKIYFVDRMLELMLRGEDLLNAVTHAGSDRLRPVVLTALTAVLGLVPLTLGGGRLWGAFGWVNIFGLIASIPLSLVLLPAIIAVAYRLQGQKPVEPGGGVMFSLIRIHMRTPLLLAIPALLAAQEPLTLQDAVAAALKEQPRLKAAEEGLRAAEARADGAALNQWGRLDTSYLYTPSQKPLEIQFPGVPPLIPPATFEVKGLQKHSFQAAFSQPLWTWGALNKQTSAARMERDATRSGLDRTRQQTAFEAARAFLTAAQAQEAVAVARQALEQQGAFAKVAKSRFEAGAAPRLDLLKAELAVARAESDLLQTRNRAQLAREALASVTYDVRFRELPLARAAPADTELPLEEAALAKALGQRPDLKALDRQAWAADLGSQAAKASRLPSVALRGSITQQHDEFSKSFHKASQLYQAGLALTWEGFSPLRTKAKSAELHAQASALRHGMRALEGAVALEVRSALLNAREARERSLVEARAVEVAEEQARVARLAYREGVLTSVEAQEAELALTGARFKRIWADLDAAMALESLRFAMGE